MKELTLESSIFLGPDHRYFQGHFPGRPIYPGVAQIQDVCDLISGHMGDNVHLVRLSRVKFLRLVEPESLLQLKVTVIDDRVEWQISKERDVCSKGCGVMARSGNPTIGSGEI